VTRSARRLARPLLIAIALVLVHAGAARTLVAREPLTALLEGQLGVGLLVIGLIAARLTLSFVVVPWTLVVAVDSALEALSARRPGGRGRLRDRSLDASDGQ